MSTINPADKTGLRLVARADLPTRFGDFQVLSFENDWDRKEHLAIVRGDLAGASDVPTRLHSECMTGDALGSLRCDCRDQLEGALRRLGGMRRGLLLYLRQEGRGIGLANKIRAYELQDQGMDTVDANLALGFEDDERDYEVAAAIVRELGIESVQLMTNNPAKIDALRDSGVAVSGRLPHHMPANDHNRDYLRTKADRSGHFADPTRRDDDHVEPALAPLAS